jgi:hypothetical protein
MKSFRSVQVSKCYEVSSSSELFKVFGLDTKRKDFALSETLIDKFKF